MKASKLITIQDWPYPNSLLELNTFLGYLIFYRKFISCFLSVAAPLTFLTEDGVDVKMGLESAKCKADFASLKDSFTKALLLQNFDFAKPPTLHVDSSKYVLSTVLSQPDAQGFLCLVSFLSKKWRKKESSWQCHNQELASVLNLTLSLSMFQDNSTQQILKLGDQLSFLMASRRNLSGP